VIKFSKNDCAILNRLDSPIISIKLSFKPSNADGLTYSMAFGNSIFLKEVHANTYFSIRFSCEPDSNVTDLSEKEWLKQNPCNTSTDAGIWSDVKLVFRKAEPAIARRTDPVSNFTDCRRGELAKQALPNCVTDDGITMNLNPVLAKERVSIVDKLDPVSNVTERSKRQSAKHDFEIVWTDKGTNKDRTPVF
jgi:hypothetical protein